MLKHLTTTLLVPGWTQPPSPPQAKNCEPLGHAKTGEKKKLAAISNMPPASNLDDVRVDKPGIVASIWPAALRRKPDWIVAGGGRLPSARSFTPERQFIRSLQRGNAQEIGGATVRLRDRAPTLGAERINCMGRSDVGGSRASVIQFQIMSCGIIELGRASARPNAEASGKKADQENAILCASAQRPYQVENVRFGSVADILTSPRHVRFTPNNGRWAAHPSQHLAVSL